MDDKQSNQSTLLPQAALAYNATKQETIRITPFFTNYRREPRLATDFKGYLPIEVIVAAEDIYYLYQQLQSNIRFLNKRIANQANKKRVTGPTLKKGDRVYLQRRHIKTRRQNSKLDFLKLGLFKIKSTKRPVNYELELPKSIRIHLVFYISLLEKADPDTPLDEYTEINLDQ